MGEESYAAYKKFDIGDIVGVTGEMFRTKIIPRLVIRRPARETLGPGTSSPSGGSGWAAKSALARIARVLTGGKRLGAVLGFRRPKRRGFFPDDPPLPGDGDSLIGAPSLSNDGVFQVLPQQAAAFCHAVRQESSACIPTGAWEGCW